MSIIDLDRHFFGRQEILQLLKKRLLGLKEGYRQNVALVGEQFVGKTTLLYKFMSDFDDADVIKIYVDLENRDFQYFFSKFAGSILYNFAKTENLPTYDDVKFLNESLRKRIPKTTKTIDKIQSDIKKGKTLETYRLLLNLREIFAVETDKFCVFLLDEFHYLDELSVRDAFQELGKKIMAQSRTLYVVTSSYPQVANKILSEKLNLLFGNFEAITLDNFDLKTSQEFIEKNLRSLKMSATLRKFLVDFTGGHPLYLNLILRELNNLGSFHKQSNIFKPILVQAIENTLFNQWGLLNRHFELIINNLSSIKGNRIIPSIFIELSNQRTRIKDLAVELDVKQSPLTQRINRLIEAGLVFKNGGFLYLKDKLFRYWVKYIFQMRLIAIDSTPDNIREEFRKEIEQVIDQFAQTSSKDLSSRIVDLFQCFDNEAFKINGRNYKLSNFNRIKNADLMQSQKKGFDILQASSAEGDWFIVLNRSSLGENDIHAILKESRSLKQRPCRCVIISLNELDQNAKLKALQERAWIWNENEINALLNYYDKPYIV